MSSESPPHSISFWNGETSVMRKVYTSHIPNWILEAIVQGPAEARAETRDFLSTPSAGQVPSPAMERVQCHIASVPSQPWSEQELEMRRSDQVAGEEEDSSSSDAQAVLTACCVQQGLDPGLTNLLDRDLLKQPALDFQAADCHFAPEQKWNSHTDGHVPMASVPSHTNY